MLLGMIVTAVWMEKMRDVLHCVDHKKSQAANAMTVLLSIPYKKKHYWIEWIEGV